MKICDLCKNTNQVNVTLKEVELCIEGESDALIDEVCPTCITKIQTMCKPKTISPAKPSYRSSAFGPLGPRSSSGIDWDNSAHQ